jgi:hypothetical protein
MSDDRWLRVATDQETMDLIKEVKERGYLVLHRDVVRTISASASFQKDHLLSAQYPAERIVREQLAHEAARFLCEDQDFPIRESERGVVNVEYRTTFQWIGTKVSPEDSEYPIYLSRYQRR